MSKHERFFPRLVRSVDLVTTYPGYSYNYFNNFQEIDDYFKKTVGDDWLDTEWARFWLRNHWSENKKENRVPNTSSGKPNKRIGVPKDIIYALIRHFYYKRKFSYRKVSNILSKHYDIEISPSSIYRSYNQWKVGDFNVEE